MNPCFVYSLDRETWLGAYPARQEAVAAGFRMARMQPDGGVGTVYVGQQVTPNLHAYGHAQHIVHEMALRVRDQMGEAADGFLDNVTPAQIDELNREIEKVVLDWLERHELMPKAREVEAISEHPLPMPHEVRQERLDEVDDAIGDEIPVV
jgi:hypothetical protein